MRKESEDKAERILSIYSRLRQGKVIYKLEESTLFGVAPRTIQRDIADIQCFLQNQNLETGEAHELVFDKSAGGYLLRTSRKNQLEGKEILAASKILLESRALTKAELFPIINKIIELCGKTEEVKITKEVLNNEMYHYSELQHKKQLLDKLWELELAICRQKYVEIKYMKLKTQKLVGRRVKPVGIIFSEFYFYLIAFIEKMEDHQDFEAEMDRYPTIYRVDRIEKLKVTEEHFSIPYKDRFEEGEYRKRIQYMYGGEIRNVKLKCKAGAIEAALDKLPTAKIIDESEGIYTLSAEVLGEGIDMWIGSQGDNVELIEKE